MFGKSNRNQGEVGEGDEASGETGTAEVSHVPAAEKPKTSTAHTAAEQGEVEPKTEEAFVQAQELESALHKTLANAPEITAVPAPELPIQKDVAEVVKEANLSPYSLDAKPQEVELNTMEGMKRGAEAVADVLSSINDVFAEAPTISIIGLFGGGFLAGTYLIAPLLAPFVAGTDFGGLNLILISWLAAIAAPFVAGVLLIALGAGIGALWGTFFRGKKLRN